MYAARTFRRSPGFTLVAVLTLALALGGNTAIFSVVDAALLRAMPFADHEELVFINGYHLVDGQPSIRGASFPEFRDWEERSRGIESMAAVVGFSLAASGTGEAERLRAEMVTSGYFEVLRVDAIRGRTFLPEEHLEPDAHPVIVISYALWERRYALDPDVIGRDLLLNDRPFTIVGITPEGFGGTQLNSDLFMAESNVSLITGVGILEARGSRFLTVIGRLAPGSSMEAAQAELDVIAVDLQESFPEAHEDRFAQLQSFRDGFLGTTGSLLWVLMGAGGVLLLIASANVANLLLVRSHSRTREIVLRRALGATTTRVSSQLLTESVMLAGLGGIAGIALARWGLAVLGPMIPQGVLPGYVVPEMSAAAFGFSLAALAVVGVATGLMPAIASARIEIATSLREGGRALSGGRRRLRAQHIFVVAQVALALVLLVGAGLLTRSFRAQLAVDTGSEIEGVLALSLQLPREQYDSFEAITAFAAELERRVLETPGVSAAALSTDLPFRSGSSGAYIFRQDAPDDRIRYHRHVVSMGYLEALGVELVEGRGFTADDGPDAPGVVMITESMARRVFPEGGAVGRTMYLRQGASNPVEIVGVLADVRYRNLTTSLMAEANSPDVFLPYWQFPSSGFDVAVRSDQREPEALGPALRAIVAELDASLPVNNVLPLIQSYEVQTATPRFAAFLMSVFSVLAAILACVGIYGVLAFAVGERSQEIAIRRAIGATGGSVAAAVIGEGLKLAMIGLAVGGVGALAGARVLDGFLFEVGTTDPLTFVLVGGLMVIVASLAALVPALRAMRRDPAEALSAN